MEGEEDEDNEEKGRHIERRREGKGRRERRGSDGGGTSVKQ